MSSILTNTGAMVALQTLRGVNANLSNTQDQISTGMKVASAKDNAAIWAISKVMESDVKGFRGIKESLSLGQSSVTVARTASETITNLLTDIKGKIVAAQEANVDRGKIQTDIAELRNQIGAVVNAAQFNGLNMVDNDSMVSILSSLDRGADGTVTARSITVAGQGLGMQAAVAGTTESAELTAAATVTGLDSDAVAVVASGSVTIGDGVDSNEEEVTFTLTGTAPNVVAGTATQFTVNGVTISVTLGDEANAAAMATAIEGALQDARDNGVGIVSGEQAALAGIFVDATGADVSIYTEDRATTVAVDFTDLNAVAGVTALSGGQATATIDASLVSYATNVTVGDATIAVALTSGMDNAAVAAAVASAVEGAALPGVTVARDGAELSFTNASGAELAVDLSDLASAAGLTFAGDDGVTIADNTAKVAFAGDELALAGGDTFTVTLGSGASEQSFSYTLEFSAPDTAEGRAAAFALIAEGLAAEINAADGFSASVSDDGQLVIGNTGATAAAFGIEAFTDGSSAGRLNALASIDVSTREGAESALSAIEGLIQTAIDASATFGSAQGRIDQQTEFVNQLTDALRAGIGTLIDADMEEASARLQALQVQQQLAIQSLSIANQQPQNILSLFR